MSLFRIRLRPDPGELTQQVRRANERLQRRLPQVAEVLGRAGVTLAKDEAPKDTGRFAASHGHDVERIPSGVRVRVGAGVGPGGFAQFGGRDIRSLALWITSGTRAHTITGNPYLAFYWAKVGRFMVVRSVRHPGTKPNDYMARAALRWKPQAEKAARRLGEEWIKDIEG